MEFGSIYIVSRLVLVANAGCALKTFSSIWTSLTRIILSELNSK